MITYRFVPQDLKVSLQPSLGSTTTVAVAPLVIEVPPETLKEAGPSKMEARIRELLDDMVSTLNKEFGG